MFEFKFPDVGEGITEGEIVSLKIREGDEVKEDQVVAEVETDKAVAEISSPRTGKIAKVNFKEGDVVKVGQVFFVVDDGAGASDSGLSSESKKEVKSEVDVESERSDIQETSILKEPKKPFKSQGSLSVVPEPIIPEHHQEVKRQVTEKNLPEKAIAVPAVRKIAKEMNIDIEWIKGSGPDGRILKEDLENFKQGNAGEIVEHREKYEEIPQNSQGSFTRIPLKGIRKTIAKNMEISSRTIPHVTVIDEVNVEKLVQFREKEKRVAESYGVKLSYLPFIVKAIIGAMKKYPYVNSSIDMEKEEILIKRHYHMGIAVDTDAGLMVPIIKDADQKSILEIAKEIQELAEKARQRKISVEELKGSTFTITNYGSIGGMYGTPIINYPEAAILGLGRMYDKAIVEDGEVKIAKVLPLSFVFDHRIFDGAYASYFMEELKNRLSDPELLIV